MSFCEVHMNTGVASCYDDNVSWCLLAYREKTCSNRSVLVRAYTDIN
jgi:hypothetical protein